MNSPFFLNVVIPDFYLANGWANDDNRVLTVCSFKPEGSIPSREMARNGVKLKSEIIQMGIMMA